MHRSKGLGSSRCTQLPVNVQLHSSWHQHRDGFIHTSVWERRWFSKAVCTIICRVRATKNCKAKPAVGLQHEQNLVDLVEPECPNWDKVVDGQRLRKTECAEEEKSLLCRGAPVRKWKCVYGKPLSRQARSMRSQVCQRSLAQEGEHEAFCKQPAAVSQSQALVFAEDSTQQPSTRRATACSSWCPQPLQSTNAGSKQLGDTAVVLLLKPPKTDDKCKDICKVQAI